MTARTGKPKLHLGLVLTQAELEAQVETLKADIELARGKAFSGKADTKQTDVILANLRHLATDSALRIQVKEWVIANVKKMAFDGSKLQFAILFKSGVRALYQFRNKYTEGEATFIPDFPKA